MKKIILFTSILFAFHLCMNAQTTIYNHDDALKGNRKVSQKGYFLNVDNDGNSNLFISGKYNFVGIGTIDPTVKLDVIGTVRGKNGYFENIRESGYVFESQLFYLNNSHVFGAGYKMDFKIDNFNVPRYNFNVYDFQKGGDNINDFVHVNIVDRKNKERFIFNAYADEETNQNGRMMFAMTDKKEYEVIKINDDGDDNVFIHLPKKNSRIVIANWGNYLPEHKFVVADGSAMIEGNIFTNSNIGVGTNNFTDGNDSYRVSVNGAIRAHRVRVYTTWADYVFAKNYSLPTLEEVEKHITDNGHLKDIPSAKEVEEKGIELGEMNKLLLQKIEELTLYMIEMNKEIQTLKSQIKNN